MELSVLERLVLLNVLPAEGNFTTLKIVRQLREALSFSEDEHATLQFKQDDKRLAWQDEGQPADIEIGSKAQALIVETLEKLDKDGKLTEQHMSLYEKFIGD